MSLTLEDVDHVAALARLALNDDERERMRDQLASILEQIAAIDELDTAAIAPTAQVNQLINVMRDDVSRPSLSQAEALANAPRVRDGFFEVDTPLGGDPETG